MTVSKQNFNEEAVFLQQETKQSNFVNSTTLTKTRFAGNYNTTNYVRRVSNGTKHTDVITSSETAFPRDNLKKAALAAADSSIYASISPRSRDSAAVNDTQRRDDSTSEGSSNSTHFTDTRDNRQRVKPGSAFHSSADNSSTKANASAVVSNDVINNADELFQAKSDDVDR